MYIAFKTEQLTHQKLIYDKTKNEPFWAYFLDMGTGKTKLTLDVIYYQYAVNNLRYLIILCNRGCYLNFEDQFKEHYSGEYIIGVYSSSSNKKQLDLVDYILQGGNKDKLNVLLCTINTLSSKDKTLRLINFAKKYGAGCVIDESSSIKNPKALMTKGAIFLGKHCTFRRVLTGSPCDNSPLNVWSQFEFLQPGCLGFENYYVFRSRYAILFPFSIGTKGVINIVKGYRDMDDLRLRMSKYASFVSKQECVDLPEKIYTTRYITLTTEQKEAYDNIKHNLIHNTDKGICATQYIISQIVKLRQICNGFLVLNNSKVEVFKNDKINILNEISGELDNGIIWCEYVRQIKTVYDIFKNDRAFCYYGVSTTAEREFIKNNCNSDKIKWIISNPQSGGYGNNWAKFHNVIYLSSGFDLEKRRQSEDRCHRLGQKHNVTYIDIVAKNTIEEKILNVLKKKKELSLSLIVSNIKEYI